MRSNWNILGMMLLRNLSWFSEYKSLSISPRRYDVDDMEDGWVLSTSQGSLGVEMPFRGESQMQILQGTEPLSSTTH